MFLNTASPTPCTLLIRDNKVAGLSAFFTVCFFRRRWEDDQGNKFC